MGFDQVKNIILNLGTDGVKPALVFLALLVGGKVLALLWKMLSEQIQGRVKACLEKPIDLAISAVFGVSLFVSLAESLWYTAITAAAAFIAYLLLHQRLKLIHYGLGLALTVQVIVCTSAYILNLRHLDNRANQYDVAFVLVPKGYPHEELSNKVYGYLYDTLKVAFKGVRRVWIAPETQKQEELKRYSDEMNSKDSLSYRTKERSFPRVVIGSSFNIETYERHRVMSMSLDLYSKSSKTTKFQPAAGWEKDSPFIGTENELRWIALYASYRLAYFLIDKKLIRLTTQEQNSVWLNILVDYKGFLSLRSGSDSNSRLRTEVERVNVSSPITSKKLGSLLAKYRPAYKKETREAASVAAGKTLLSRY